MVFDSDDESLCVCLTKHRSGEVDLLVHVRNRLHLHNEFTLCFCSDQTFLPELCGDLLAALSPSVTPDADISIQWERAFSLQVSPMGAIADCMLFRLDMKDSFFHVLVDACMSGEEYQRLKEDLYQLLKGAIRNVVWSPWGGVLEN